MSESNNVININLPQSNTLNDDLQSAGLIDFPDYVVGTIDIPFEDLLNAFRDNGTEVTRFIIDDNNKLTHIAND